MGKKLWIGLGIGLLALLILVSAGYFMFTKGGEKPLLGIEGAYDEDGNIINSDTQAVVGDKEGVFFLKFNINVKNVDYVPLTFSIVSGTPEEFNIALPVNEITVEKGEYATWTTDLVDITPYVGTKQKFTVTIQGDSPRRKSNQTTAVVEVEIKEDPVSAFDVNIVYEANNEPEQVLEPTPTPITTKIKFRTNDIEYKSGGAIAFAESCGSNLIAYGYESSVSNSRSCDGRIDLLHPAIMQVPTSDSKIKKLYRDSTNPNEVFICYDTSTGSSSKRYDKTDSDASKVSTDLLILDQTKEVVC